MAGKWISAAEAGAIIRAAREARSMTQDQVAERVDVDKSYISKLESGQHHAGRSKYFPQLAETLGLSSADVQLLNPGAVVKVSPATSVTHAAPVFLELPTGLRDAIDLYGPRFNDLQDPAWQQYLAGFNWRTGRPEEPERWLDLYRDLARAGVVPGGN